MKLLYGGSCTNYNQLVVMWVDRTADLDGLLLLFVWVIVSASSNS